MTINVAAPAEPNRRGFLFTALAVILHPFIRSKKPLADLRPDYLTPYSLGWPSDYYPMEYYPVHAPYPGKLRSELSCVGFLQLDGEDRDAAERYAKFIDSCIVSDNTIWKI
jgi:hypothetical protein